MSSAMLGSAKRLHTCTWVAALAIFSPVAFAGEGDPLHPFPQHIVYADGSLLPNHRSELQRDDDVRSLYDSWKALYLSPAGVEPDGHPRYRVRMGRALDAATVSEAQGYGMILAVLMAGHDPDAREILDGLLEFTLDHPSEIDSRLMDWWVPADEALDPAGNDSAFDGDADIAYALLLASQQWGDEGRFDYRARARVVLAGLLESAVGPSSHLPMLGDWVDPGGTTYSELTPRPSDFMPDHFRAFAEATGNDTSEWDEVRSAVMSTLVAVQSSYAPSTGLIPDFLEPVSASDSTLRPADPNFLEGPNDGAYYYNSTRVPLRLGVDALVNHDATSRSVLATLSLWAEQASQSDPALLLSGFALDGTPLPGSQYFTTAFAAPLAVAAMTVPTQQQWLNDLYDTARVSDEGYYEDTLSLLSLLVMSGNYWSPTTFTPHEVPGLSLAGFAALVFALALGAVRA